MNRWFFYSIALALLFVATGRGGDNGRPTRVTVTVCGATDQVSGSLTVLDTGSAKWLVDCGAYFPEGDDDERQAHADSRSATLPVDARSIVAVFVTHAHLDHIGRIPLLVQQGFPGPIYVTEPTRVLVPVMLDMEIRYDRGRTRDWVWSKRSLERAQSSKGRLTLHWRAGCEYRQKINPSNLQTAQGTLAGLAGRFGGTEVPGIDVRIPRELSRSRHHRRLAQRGAHKHPSQRKASPRPCDREGVRVLLGSCRRQ